MPPTAAACPLPAAPRSWRSVRGQPTALLPLPIVDQLPARHVRAAWRHAEQSATSSMPPDQLKRSPQLREGWTGANLFKKPSNMMSRPSICGQDGRIPEGGSQNTGGVMGNAKPARRLSRATRTGLRDLPSNTAWLLSKALAPAVSAGEGASKAVSSAGESMSGTVSSAAGSAGAATSGVRRKAKAVRQSVVEAVPGIGHDSVASLMQQADAAAEQARDEEARALELAQQAKDSAGDAERVARESDQFVQEVRQEAERKTAERMEEAQERFDRARLEAEAEAQDTIEKAEAKASARTRERQQNAEQAQVRAREAIQEANKALARARDLAGEAAKAAEDVAAQASREADRLAKQARERMATIERRATQAEKTKQAAEKRIETAGVRPHGTPPEVTLHDSQSLDALTKDQLLRLAEDLELESQSAASKQELIEAIIRNGGVPASALSKEELLRIARSTGSEVGTSMTKAELITAIDTSLVPVAGQQSEREAQCVYSLVRASGTVLWTPRQRPLQMPRPGG